MHFYYDIVIGPYKNFKSLLSHPKLLNHICLIQIDAQRKRMKE